jgi:shikimate 5-dehydrogenase
VLFEGEVEGVEASVRAMGEVRYAVAGDPINHSLSPLLLGLVHARLLDLLGQKEFNLKLKNTELVPATTIEGALAWGYAGSVPSPPDWAYTNAPFGKFRTTGLLTKAIEAGMAVEDADDRFAPTGEATLSMSTPTVATDSKLPLPTGFLRNEIWVNLTSPLKHQLSSTAVSAIDDSMSYQSVNALRWDGQGWWCAGLDGAGVVALAQHFGISFSSNPVLSLCGGGGAARSVASAWLEAGGQVHVAESRRALPDELLVRCAGHAKDAVFGVNFDSEIAAAQAPILLNAAYTSFEGDIERMLDAMQTPHLNGRWMLVAQHLSCWATLWAPHLAHILPSIDLLLTQLLHAEALLHSYA